MPIKPIFMGTKTHIPPRNDPTSTVPSPYPTSQLYAFLLPLPTLCLYLFLHPISCLETSLSALRYEHDSSNDCLRKAQDP